MMSLGALVFGAVLFMLLILGLAAIVVLVFRRLSVFDKGVGGRRGGRDEEEEENLPYRKKDYLLTRGERAFYGALQEGVGGEYLILPKVRLADLLWLPKGTGRRQSHFNRISSKHVDFVLCHRETVAPLLAVELDDRSHERADRQERDAFVDGAFRASQLPVLHVQARASYSALEVAERVRGALGEGGAIGTRGVVRANTGRVM